MLRDPHDDSAGNFAADWKLVAGHMTAIGDKWFEVIDMPEEFWNLMTIVAIRFASALKWCAKCMEGYLEVMKTSKAEQGVEDMLLVIERMLTVAASTVRIIPFIHQGKEGYGSAPIVTIQAARIADRVLHYVQSIWHVDKANLDHIVGNPQMAMTFETAIKCARLLASQVDSQLLAPSKLASTVAPPWLLNEMKGYFLRLLNYCLVTAHILDCFYTENYVFNDKIDESSDYSGLHLQARFLANLKTLKACVISGGISQQDLATIIENVGCHSLSLSKVMLPEEAAVLLMLRDHVQDSEAIGQGARAIIDKASLLASTPMTPARLILHGHYLLSAAHIWIAMCL